MEFEELKQRFGTDKQCREYIGRLRWKDGFLCPICSGREAWVTGKVEYKCKDESCKHHKVSVTSGTIFDGSHIPLPKWFEMIWYLCENGFRCSAAELQEKFCLGSNRTAQKVKRDFDKLAKEIYLEPTKHKLNGTVEVSTQTIKVKGKNAPIIVAVETGVKGNRSIRARYVKSNPPTEEQIIAFIRDFIEQGSTIICQRLSVSSPIFKQENPEYKKKTMLETYAFRRTEKAAQALESWLDKNFVSHRPNHCIMRYCSYLENCGNPIPFDSFLKIAVQTKTPVRLRKEKEKARRQESASE